ncbi:MAG TPA: hypothetical protein PLZ37_15705 [Nitrospira sp.]|nr:hypothetical protein [Nitrospira sp.]
MERDEFRDASIQGVTIVVWIMSAGCASDYATPTRLETRSVANGIAEDHVAASRLYRQKANQLTSDVVRLEQQAERVSSHEDSKGFRRDALRTAAQTLRQEALEVEQLHAAHSAMVQSVIGKQQPQ